MFCTECICHTCPYGLKCRDCDTWLDDHIHLIEGCNGQRKSNECLFDYVARVETGIHDHAEMLREYVRTKNYNACKEFFDYKTGPYHKKSRDRYQSYLESKENPNENG